MKLELCQYCKRIRTYRKTNGIAECAICESNHFQKNKISDTICKTCDSISDNDQEKMVLVQ